MNTKSKNIIKRILSIFLVIVTVLSSLSLDNISNLFVKKVYAAGSADWGEDINTKIVQAAINRFGYGYPDKDNTCGDGATYTNYEFNNTTYNDLHIYACDSLVGYSLREAGFTGIPSYASNGSSDSFAKYAQQGYVIDEDGNTKKIKYNGVEVSTIICQTLPDFINAINNPNNSGKIITLATPYLYTSLAGARDDYNKNNPILREGMILSWEQIKTYDNTDIPIITNDTVNGQSVDMGRCTYKAAGNHSSICLGYYKNTNYGSIKVNKNNKDILGYGNWLNTQLRNKYTFPSNVITTQLIYQDFSNTLKTTDGATLNQTSTIYQAGADPSDDYLGYKKYNYRHVPNKSANYGNLFIQGSPNTINVNGVGVRQENPVGANFCPIIESASTDKFSGGVRIASYDGLNSSNKQGFAVRITYFKPVEDYYVAFDSYKVKTNDGKKVAGSVYAVMPDISTSAESNAQQYAKDAALKSSSADAVDYFVSKMGTSNVLGFITTPAEGTNSADIRTYISSGGKYVISNTGTGCAFKVSSNSAVKFNIIEIWSPEDMTLDGNVYMTNNVIPTSYYLSSDKISNVTSASTNNTFTPITINNSTDLGDIEAYTTQNSGWGIDISTVRSDTADIITYSNSSINKNKVVKITKDDYSATLGQGSGDALRFTFKDRPLYSYWASWDLNKKTSTDEYVANAAFITIPTNSNLSLSSDTDSTTSLTDAVAWVSANSRNVVYYRNANDYYTFGTNPTYKTIISELAKNSYNQASKQTNLTEAQKAQYAVWHFYTSFEYISGRLSTDTSTSQYRWFPNSGWLANLEGGYWITTGNATNATMKRYYMNSSGHSVISNSTYSNSDFNSNYTSSQVFRLNNKALENVNINQEFVTVEVYAPYDIVYDLSYTTYNATDNKYELAEDATITQARANLDNIKKNTTLANVDNPPYTTVNGTSTTLVSSLLRNNEAKYKNYWASFEGAKKLSEDGTTVLNEKIGNTAFIFLPCNNLGLDNYGSQDFTGALNELNSSSWYYYPEYPALRGPNSGKTYTGQTALLNAIAEDAYYIALHDNSYNTNKTKAERAIQIFFENLRCIYDSSSMTKRITTTNWMKGYEAGYIITDKTNNIDVKRAYYDTASAKHISGLTSGYAVENQAFLLNKHTTNNSATRTFIIVEAYVPNYDDTTHTIIDNPTITRGTTKWFKIMSASPYEGEEYELRSNIINQLDTIQKNTYLLTSASTNTDMPTTDKPNDLSAYGGKQGNYAAVIKYTNTKSSGKNVTVTKDSDNLGMIKSIKVELTDNNNTKITTDRLGNSITNSVTLDSTNNWTYSWLNLDTSKTYKVREIEIVYYTNDAKTQTSTISKAAGITTSDNSVFKITINWDSSNSNVIIDNDWNDKNWYYALKIAKQPAKNSSANYLANARYMVTTSEDVAWTAIGDTSKTGIGTATTSTTPVYFTKNSNTAIWKETTGYYVYTAPTMEFYVAETKASTNYSLFNGVYKAVVQAGTNSDGSNSKLIALYVKMNKTDDWHEITSKTGEPYGYIATNSALVTNALIGYEAISIDVYKSFDNSANSNIEYIEVKLLDSSNSAVTKDVYGNNISSTVQLNSDNNWHYQWNDMDPNKTYHVEEVSVKRNGEAKDTNVTALYDITYGTKIATTTGIRFNITNAENYIALGAVKVEEGQNEYKTGATYKMMTNEADAKALTSNTSATVNSIIAETTTNASGTKWFVFNSSKAVNGHYYNSPTNGVVAISVGSADTYTVYIVETKAPSGYGRREGYWKVVLNTVDDNTGAGTTINTIEYYNANGVKQSNTYADTFKAPDDTSVIKFNNAPDVQDFYATWNAVKYTTDGDQIANTAFVYLPSTILNRNSISTTSFSNTLKSINDGTTEVVYNGTTYTSTVRLLRALAKATNDYVWATYPNATDSERANYAVAYFYNQLGLVEGSTTGTVLNSQNWYKNNEFAYAITKANAQVVINRVYINGTAPVVTNERQVFRFANNASNATESVSKAFYFLEIYTPKGIVFPGNNAFGLADITSNYSMSKDSDFDSTTASLNPNNYAGSIATSTEIVLRDDYHGIYTILDNDDATHATKVAGTNQEYLAGGFGLKKTFIDKNNVEQTVSGVQYGIYSNSTCTKLLGTVTTGDTGYAVIDVNDYLTSDWIETSPTKTAYVKELSVENAKIAGTNTDISSYLELDPTVYKYVVTGISETDAYSTTGVKNYSTCTIVETNMTTNVSTTLSTTAVIANNTYNVKITNKNNEVYTQDAWFGIKKIDETTGNPIGGIQFKVYSDQNLTDLLGTITTDNNGLGTYDFDEINPLSSNDVIITETVYVQEVGSTATIKGYKPINDIIKVDVTFAANKEDSSIVATNLTTNTPVDIETNANPKFMYFTRPNRPDDAYAAVGVRKYVIIDGQEVLLGEIKFTFYADEQCTQKIKTVTTYMPDGSDKDSKYDAGCAGISLSDYVTALNVQGIDNATPFVVYAKETNVTNAKRVDTKEAVSVDRDTSVIKITLWASKEDATLTEIVSATKNNVELDLTQVKVNNYTIKAFEMPNDIESYHGIIGAAKIDNSANHNAIGGMKFNVYTGYSDGTLTGYVDSIITAESGTYKGIGTLDISKVADATHAEGAWTLNTAKTFYIQEDKATAESKNLVWDNTVIKAVVTPSEDLSEVTTNYYKVVGTTETLLTSGSTSTIGENNTTSSIITTGSKSYNVKEIFTDEEDSNSITTIVYAIYSQQNTVTINHSGIKSWGNTATRDIVKEVYLTLYANDNIVTVDATGTAIENPGILTSANGWYYEWTNLNKYDSNGNEITYTVRETKIVLTEEYGSQIFTNIEDYFKVVRTENGDSSEVNNTLLYYNGSFGVKKVYTDVHGVEHSLSGVVYNVYSDADCEDSHLVANGSTDDLTGIYTYSIPNNTWKSVEGKTKVFYFKEIDNSNAKDTVTGNAVELYPVSEKIYKATITITVDGDTITSTTTYEVVGSNEVVETDTNNNITVVKQSNEEVYHYKANLAAMKVDQSSKPVANVKFNVYAESDVTNNTLKDNATPIYTIITTADGTKMIDVLDSWTAAELRGTSINSKVFYIQEDKNSVESLNLIWNDGLIKATVTPVLIDAEHYNTVYEGADEVIESEDGSYAIFKRINTLITSVPVKKVLDMSNVDEEYHNMVKHVMVTLYNGDVKVTTNALGQTINSTVDLMQYAGYTYTWENLDAYGDYHVVEESVTVTIDNTDKVITGTDIDNWFERTTQTVGGQIVITNKIKPKYHAKVTICKVDDEGNPLAARFGIYSNAACTNSIEYVNVNNTYTYSTEWFAGERTNNYIYVYIKEISTDASHVPYPYVIRAKMNGNTNPDNCTTTFDIRENGADADRLAVAEDNKFSATIKANYFCATKTGPVEVTVPNPITVVKISKRDILTAEEIADAHLQIITLQAIDWNGTHYNANTVIDEWTSVANESHEIKGLPTGSYKIHETYAPSAFLLNDIDETFTIVDGLVDQGTKIFTNSPTSILVNKEILTGNDDVNGARMQLTNGTYTVTWTTGNNGSIVVENNGGTKVQARAVTISGKWYVELLYVPYGTLTVTELEAPEGFNKANTYGYTVTNTTSQHVITIKDAPNKVQIFKEDLVSGNTIPNAYLELRNSDNSFVLSWTTGNDNSVSLVSSSEAEATVVNENGRWSIQVEKIPAGTYTLTETTATSGFAKHEVMTITVVNSTATQVFTMKDTPYKASISKLDIETGAPVVDAHLQLITNQDIEWYDVDTNTLTIWAKDAVIDEWDTDGTNVEHAINYLPVGSYTLRETRAPEELGYVVAEDITFNIVEVTTSDINGETWVETKKTMYDDFTKLELDKYNVYTNERLAGCKLAIYKVDANGNKVGDPIDVWVTDGINAHSITRIPVGNYVLTELEAPETFALAADVYFTVEGKSTTQVNTISDAPLTALPETGGVGTMLFTLGGLLMMLIALLLKKKTI